MDIVWPCCCLLEPIILPRQGFSLDESPLHHRATYKKTQLWEEAVAPGQNPRRRTENIYASTTFSQGGHGVNDCTTASPSFGNFVCLFEQTFVVGVNNSVSFTTKLFPELSGFIEDLRRSDDCCYSDSQTCHDHRHLSSDSLKLNQTSLEWGFLKTNFNAIKAEN